MFHLQFLHAGQDRALALTGVYHVGWVAVSVLMAVLAAYTALKLTGRMTAVGNGRVEGLWLAAGSTAMGIGIWAMHFIGMLGFRLPVAVSYDLTVTLLSVAPAILSSAAVLRVSSHKKILRSQLVGTGLVMGAGIGAMHYTGMAAMRTTAQMYYDPVLFALSVVIAVVLAIVSLYVQRLAGREPRARGGTTHLWAALIMGLAVSGMHYTAMGAVYFFPGDTHWAAANVIDPTLLGKLVGAGSTVVLSLTIFAVLVDVRLKGAASALERQRMIIEAVPAAMVMADQQGRIALVNGQTEKSFGYSREELLGQPIEVLLPERFRERWEEYFGEPAVRSTPVGRDLYARRKDGSELPVEIGLNPVDLPEGHMVLSSITDITERKRAEAELAGAYAELETRVRDRTAELANANRNLEESLRAVERGRRDLSLVGDLVDLLQTSQSAPETREILEGFGQKAFPELSGAVYLYRASRNVLEIAAQWGHGIGIPRALEPGECWALRRGRRHVMTQGNHLPRCNHIHEVEAAYATCIPLMAQGETNGVFVLFGDIDPSAHAELAQSVQNLATLAAEQVALALANLALRDKLRDQAIRDPLTNLFNRRYFEETLDRELQRAARQDTQLSLVMIDIDHFKRFNDSFGHEAGDLVLKRVGSVFADLLRGEDVACRYGGEEFALLLADTRAEVACTRAEDLRKAITALDLKRGGEGLGPITISCGVAAFPYSGSVRDELINAADQALYRAKKEGRDRVELALVRARR